MTDSERLAEIRKSRATINAPKRPPYPEGPEDFLLRLLDTTRSERDAALARVGDLEALLLVLNEDMETWLGDKAQAAVTAALTPPAYPPEQPL